MKNTRNELLNRFAGKVLLKEELLHLKGGGSSKISKEEKEARKRCEKAWENAEKTARKHGRRLKRINGNGNGIW